MRARLGAGTWVVGGPRRCLCRARARPDTLNADNRKLFQEGREMNCVCENRARENTRAHVIRKVQRSSMHALRLHRPRSTAKTRICSVRQAAQSTCCGEASVGRRA